MLPKISLSRLTNGDLIAFISSVIKLYQRIAPPTLVLDIADLSVKLQELNVAYSTESSSLLTEDLASLDFRRNEALQGLRMAARAYMKYHDPTVRDAAKLIMGSMQNYGRYMERLNYQAKSVAINGLVREWTNDVMLADALSILNFQNWKQELSAANDAFRAVFLDRVSEEAAKNTPSVTAQRGSATEVYRVLERKTVAHAVLDAATYEPLIENLSELIKKFKVTI